MAGFRLRLSRGRSRPGTAARPGRFRAMISNRMLWPGLIGIALAVGLGVQMGESTVGEINPIHFQGAAPPVRPFDPAVQPPPVASTYAQAYGWQEGDAARQADSGNQDFDYMPPPATVQRTSEQVMPPPPSMAPWPPGQVSSHPQIERYTDYPIETKPAAPPEPEPVQPDQPDATALSPSGK
jgi:hypothetical protein